MAHKPVIAAMIVLLLLNVPAIAQHDSPQLRIVGEEEIVFDWTTDRCEFADIPDLPARAFRDDAGNVQLIAAHFDIFRSIGADLDSVVRDCTPVMRSDYQTDPTLHQGNQWISGLYTEDGTTIYTIFHNEYHNVDMNNDFGDWYNVLTAGISTDSGASYQTIAPAPDHFVAGLPYQYESGAGPYGILESSNIIQGVDDAYYFFGRVDDYRSENQWICLFRNPILADHTNWQAWDGTAFTVNLTDPYTSDTQNQCAPIASNQIGLMNQSITYNTYLNQYVLLGITADTINEQEIWGIYYAFSDDLINWSHRQLLSEQILPWTYQADGDNHNPILYPTLIDSDSPSRNFETTDNTAYLYFTRMNYQNGQQTLDRDLIRVPVQFFRSSADADNPERIAELTASINESLLEGILTTVNNQPITNAEIQLTILPADEERLSQRTGTVPEGATNALVGWRVNTECDCNGSADITVYETQFLLGEDTENLVPNGDFSQGHNSWGFSGSEFALTTNDGIQIAIDETMFATANSALFDVTANQTYTLRIDAIIGADTLNSGYFMVIFTDGNSEIQRDLLIFRPNSNDIGTVITDEHGQFSLQLENITPNTIIQAQFNGTDQYNPIRVQTSSP